ncbi:Hypothetical predicted protein, partial [Paramuricea clavata]
MADDVEHFLEFVLKRSEEISLQENEDILSELLRHIDLLGRTVQLLEEIRDFVVNAALLLTTIIIAPTRNPPMLLSTVLAIQQSPIPSILQSSDLATPRLVTESVMMTSSSKESAVLKALSSIQASPTTPEVLPSSTLTPE